MVVSAGGVPVGAEHGTTRPGTRRDVLRGLLAPAVVVALAPVVAASRPSPPEPRPGEEAAFDETYRGRHIQGFRTVVTDDGHAFDGEQWQVTVDGRPLHLMRRADGSWLSMVDHYRSYPTPLDAARAAVDEMGPGEQLRDMAPGPMSGERMDMGGHIHMGGDHGVHA
ncbi:tyrosinase cofactor [Streptomyces cylindrosporus]|uniref:Tyrosinase cofactor n=1 Tax=Streptomyces cylindrosporus TaxID=2927583 RepID=A0ABS9XX44_9ACTN|nr:tyrosinase cofactor [Streptomyces cylindrosporus]MCI3269527.1 tyrosinase cofactor [Streptomyces cylindrosporus]